MTPNINMNQLSHKNLENNLKKSLAICKALYLYKSAYKTLISYGLIPRSLCCGKRHRRWVQGLALGFIPLICR